jgi:hypothetical protein
MQIKIREVSAAGEVSRLIYSKLCAEVTAWRTDVYNKHLENYLYVFTENNKTYIVTEGHPECLSLREHLSHRVISLTAKLLIMKKIASVLSSCLNLKIPQVHGHLHPGNILVLAAKVSTQKKMRR